MRTSKSGPSQAAASRASKEWDLFYDAAEGAKVAPKAAAKAGVKVAAKAAPKKAASNAPSKRKVAREWDPFMEERVAPKARVAAAGGDFDFFDDEAFDGKPTRKKGRPQSRKLRRKLNNWWVAPVTMVMLALLGVMGYLATNALNRQASFQMMRATVERDTFYPGVTINGTDVSSVTLNDAMAKFAENDQNQRNHYRVTLVSGDQKWELKAEDMGYQNNYREMLSSAWAVGRYGTIEERYRAVTALANEQGQSFEIQSGPSRDALKARVEAIAEELSVQPVNAKIESFNPSTLSFGFTESKDGIVVNKEALLEQVMAAIDSGTETVEIKREAVSASRTPESLSAIYGEVSTATTNASSSSSNRITNIRLACQAMDGHLIKPGETFSFNEVVGKRTREKGYKPAGAIENGIMTDQVGGGICQVSTTLFNAVAKADLTIVERSPHSRPSTYVDLGKDAAVDWPNQDFKFRNDGDTPVYIVARVTDNKRVVIKIFGQKLKDGMSIAIDSKRTATVEPGGDRYIKDKNLAKGEEVVVEGPRKGYRAETYKVYLDANGNEIRRELLCKSTYASSGRVIKVGS